jgi:hypothetical protein
VAKWQGFNVSGFQGFKVSRKLPEGYLFESAAREFQPKSLYGLAPFLKLLTPCHLATLPP